MCACGGEPPYIPFTCSTPTPTLALYSIYLQYSLCMYSLYHRRGGAFESDRHGMLGVAE